MTDLTIEELAAAIRKGKVSPVEATEACLARISRLDGRLRAFITLDADGALRTARALGTDAAAGRWRGPLHGVPLAFKDLCHLARTAHVVRDEDAGIFCRRLTIARPPADWWRPAPSRSASST